MLLIPMVLLLLLLLFAGPEEPGCTDQQRVCVSH
jgi:hypothetical protein